MNINSEQRQYFHLAATITNNFSNHLIALAKNELDHKGLDYQILKHLLSNALNNSFNFDLVINFILVLQNKFVDS